MITAIAIAGLVFAGLCGSYRIAVGPSDGDRVAAADLLTFSFIGLIAVIGLRVGSLGSLTWSSSRPSSRSSPRSPWRGH